MRLTLMHKRRPLTLDVQEHVEKLDATRFDGASAVGVLARLSGRVLSGLPFGAGIGGEIKLRGRRLHARLRLLDARGAFRSEGAYVLAPERATP